MINLTKLWTGVTQPADGAYLLVRMENKNHSNRGIANIDTQGNVHPDQFWQDVILGNVKRMPFSEICSGGFRTRAACTNQDDFWGSDPGCYPTKSEITEKSPALV